MTTIMNDVFDMASIDTNLTPGRDEAWAGAETSDGKLLVVGSIDNDNAFITRYTYTGQCNNSGKICSATKPCRDVTLLDGWDIIYDIKPIGGNKFIIVGSRGASFDTPLVPEPKLEKVGIALLTYKTSADCGENFYYTEEFYVPKPATGSNVDSHVGDGNPNTDDPVRYKYPTPMDGTLNAAELEILSKSSGRAIVEHEIPSFGNTIYSVALHNDDEQRTFIFQFSYTPSNGFQAIAISKPFPEIGAMQSTLRHPHAIAACGGRLLVAGQSNSEDFVIASWSENDLSVVSFYEGPPIGQKPKMVACAGPNGNGALACGAFPGGGTKVMGLAYFDDPTLGDYNATTPPDIEEFSTEINTFNAPGFPNTPSWPSTSNDPIPLSAESYAQAMAPRMDNGTITGWILAGQAGPGLPTNINEHMVAMIVEPTVSGVFDDFSVTHFTEVFNGDNAAETNFANYVIQLSDDVNGVKRYALFGKADWGVGGDNNTYVVIVSE